MKISFLKLPLFLSALLPLALHCQDCAAKELLRGNITRENVNPETVQPRTPGADSELRPKRLTRQMVEQSGLLQSDKAQESVAQSKKTARANFFGFADPKDTKFEPESESATQELKLAWESWHKEVSGQLYKRFCLYNTKAGKVTVKITVNRSHRMTVEILDTEGSTDVELAVHAGVRDLDGNPGLSFPALSKRDDVVFQKIFICSPYVTPGYAWKTDDFEQIRLDK